MTPTFVSGLNLSERFFYEIVEPLIEECCPNLHYSAGLIGPGSEVLGFDTALSMDHDWGLRVLLFLTPSDLSSYKTKIQEFLALRLPPHYMGFATGFSEPNPDDGGTQTMASDTCSLIRHGIKIHTAEQYFLQPNSHLEWLAYPSQKLLEQTCGKVFRDELNINQYRAKLAWYPNDVWLYILGSLWNRIGQEEHLMGRALQNRDFMGGFLLKVRIVEHIMNLCFLLEKQYAPYPKWFGSAFKKLVVAPQIAPLLESILQSFGQATDYTLWQTMYKQLWKTHQNAGIDLQSEAFDLRPFFTRPYQTVNGGNIAIAIFAKIQDPGLVKLSQEAPTGNINTITDNTDILENPKRCFYSLQSYL